MKINKRTFTKEINFNQLKKLPKNTTVYIVPRHKSKREYDKTGTFDLHTFLKIKLPKYILLKDKNNQQWALENVYAGESGRKGLFIWYNKKNKPFNWNYEYILKIKKKENDTKKIKKENSIKKINKYSINTFIKKEKNSNGRWTEEEVNLFDQQFLQYGTEWKKYNIKTKRGIRSQSQIRSFAQKHIKKKIKHNDVFKLALFLYKLSRS